MPYHSETLAWLIDRRASDLVAVLSEDLHILHANAASNAVIGYPQSALAGIDVRDLIHPADLPAVESALGRLRAVPDAPVFVRARFRHATGGHRVLETYATRADDVPEAPVIVTVSRDVTERHRRERLQRAFTEPLEWPEPMPRDEIAVRICEAVADAFELDLAFMAHAQPDGTLKIVAHAGGASQTLKTLIESEMRWHGVGACDTFAAALRNEGDGSGIAAGEIALPGAKRRVQVSAIRIHRASRSDTLLVLLWPNAGRREGSDIIGEFARQAGLMLERAEQDERLALLGKALESAANAIFITDAHGVIEWANEAFVELSGYPRDELIGQTPRVLRSGAQPADFYAALRSSLTLGQAWSGEIVNRRKDGSLYTAYQVVTPIHTRHQRTRHFVAIQQDITDRKHMEHQIRKLAADIEHARQSERERIAREVHDELGGSLASLRHDIEWLLDHVDDTRLRDRLTVMHEVAINSLDTARQIVTGLRPAIVEEVGLPEAIAWLGREVAQHHALAVSVKVEPAISRLEPTHAEQVFRVVQECLTNVTKHAGADRVSVDARVVDELLVVEVTDNGRGFGRAERVSGIQGMSERALLMGGYIEIAPSASGGTTVKLVAPAGDLEGSE